QFFAFTPNFIDLYESMFGSGALESQILSYPDLVGCIRGSLSDIGVATVLYWYNPTQVWTRITSISSYADLLDQMALYMPGTLVQAILEVDPGKATDLFSVLGAPYHVTDYLN